MEEEEIGEKVMPQIEISPETLKEIKEEEKKPETLLELMKAIMKKEKERKKKLLYDEFIPG